jgi:metal-sulfur cluster biosynthetic enzyme
MEPTANSETLAVLRRVIDPELGINIVDLGLIYSAGTNEGRVEIVMTMTTPACPMNSYLVEQTRKALMQGLPGVKEVNVKLVWDPPWGPQMMSPEAKKQFGW